MKKKLLFLIFLLSASITCVAQWEIKGSYMGAINTIALLGDKLFIGTGDGIFISSDNGISWNKANNGMPQKNVATITVSGSTIVAGVYNSNIYISTDSGATWIEKNNESLYKSTANENRWATPYNGMINNAIITEIQMFNDILYATTWGAGVFVSYNSGEAWLPYNNNLPGKYIRCITRKENKLYAATDAGIYSAPIYQWRTATE